MPWLQSLYFNIIYVSIERLANSCRCLTYFLTLIIVVPRLQSHFCVRLIGLKILSLQTHRSAPPAEGDAAPENGEMQD